jgi:hypothetical protein
LEYEDTIQQHSDANDVMERVLTAIACLAGCFPASVGESLKWTPIIQNVANTRRNLHQLLKGKQMHSVLYRVYTEVLHDLTAVLKEGAAKGETAKTIITAPPSIKEFHEQRRRKQKHTDDVDKGVKGPTTSAKGVNNPQLQ